MAAEQLALFADDPRPLEPATVAALCEQDIAARLVDLGASTADVYAVGRAAEAMRHYETTGPPPGKANRRGNPFAYRTASGVIAAHLDIPEPSGERSPRCVAMTDAHRRALRLERVVTLVADELRGYRLGHEKSRDEAA